MNKYPDGELRRDDEGDMVVGAISRVDPRDMAVQTNSTSSSCQPVLSVRPSRSWMRSPAGRWGKERNGARGVLNARDHMLDR